MVVWRDHGRGLMAMRSILVFAAIVFLGGGILARYTANEFMNSPPPAAQAKMVQPPQPVQQESSASSRRVMLAGDRSGHFRAEAEVDGRRVDFVVDTGASVVVLRESDAFRVGIRPMPRDYSARVSTANGEVKAARAVRTPSATACMPLKIDSNRSPRPNRTPTV